MMLLYRLVTVLSLMSLFQVEEVLAQALTTDDYGFQLVDQYLPAQAPFGYVSVTSAKFNLPLKPGYSYKMMFSLTATQLNGKNYTLHPGLCLTKGSEIPMDLQHDVQEVRPEIENPKFLITSGNATKATRSFSFYIIPKREYDFVTFVLEEDDLQGTPLQPRVDIKLSDVFLSVESAPRELLPEVESEIQPEQIALEDSFEEPEEIEDEFIDEFIEEEVLLEEELTAQTEEIQQQPVVELPVTETSESLSPQIQVENLPLASSKDKRLLKASTTTISVEQATARIGLYDHKRVDGDIVTIFLNDRILVENHLLTKAVAYFELPLNTGENSIVLFAENLGRVVPNTAAIIIESGQQREEVVLRSDLEQSEYFTVIRK